MEIVVHSKNSLFQQKFQKKLHHFQRHELKLCDVKNNSIGLSDKNIRLLVFLEIRLHPKTSDPLRLLNPGYSCSPQPFCVCSNWNAVSFSFQQVTNVLTAEPCSKRMFSNQCICVDDRKLIASSSKLQQWKPCWAWEQSSSHSAKLKIYVAVTWVRIFNVRFLWSADRCVCVVRRNGHRDFREWDGNRDWATTDGNMKLGMAAAKICFFQAFDAWCSRTCSFVILDPWIDCE